MFSWGLSEKPTAKVDSLSTSQASVLYSLRTEEKTQSQYSSKVNVLAKLTTSNPLLYNLLLLSLLDSKLWCNQVVQNSMELLCLLSPGLADNFNGNNVTILYQALSQHTKTYKLLRS